MTVSSDYSEQRLSAASRSAEADDASVRAIELMRTAGVAPLPKNYELFYAYAGGGNEALERSLEVEFDHGGEIPQSELDRLYEAHIADQSFCAGYARLGSRLSRHISDASQLVNEVISSNSQYGSTLEKANSRLADAADQVDVRALLAEIVKATAHMGSATHEFSTRLAAASARVETLQNEVDSLRNDLQIDSLTGISNRKHFDTALSAEMARAVRCTQPLSLLMIDIDNFKRFNDTFGHRMGDSALRLVSRMLKNAVRNHDIVARYGGEELAVILPNCEIENASVVAERFRTALAGKELIKRSTGQNLGNISVSIGIAALRLDDTEDDFVERADRALYAAKKAGRNQVALERHTPGQAERIARADGSSTQLLSPESDDLVAKAG